MRRSVLGLRMILLVLLPEALLVAAIVAEGAIDAAVAAGGSERGLLQALFVVPPVLLAPVVAGLTDRLTGSQRIGWASALLLGATATAIVAVWLPSMITRVGCDEVTSFSQIWGRVVLVALSGGVGFVAASRAGATAGSLVARPTWSLIAAGGAALAVALFFAITSLGVLAIVTSAGSTGVCLPGA